MSFGHSQVDKLFVIGLGIILIRSTISSSLENSPLLLTLGLEIHFPPEFTQLISSSQVNAFIRLIFNLSIEAPLKIPPK